MGGSLGWLAFASWADVSTQQENSMSSNDKRGFASMDEDKQRQIASKGGKAGGGDHATHEQHVQAGKQSSGGTHEQHVKAGQQSHKND
jgi:general stress protein YciG